MLKLSHKKLTLILVFILVWVNVGEAQYRKTAKPKAAASHVHHPPAKAVVPPTPPAVIDPYTQLMRQYQLQGFWLNQQYLYEQQRMQYFQQLELQRQQMYWN